MEKKQFDNEQIVLYSPDSLRYITDNMLDILTEKIEFYKDIFDIDYFRQFQINYFDDLQEFREFIYELRGERESLPEYATGTFDKGMINAYISPDIDVTTRQYKRKLFMAPHELFHIMYKELIWKKENKNRIVWYDEGMAQLFSGENDNILNQENFNKWFNYVMNRTLIIPNLNELKHGASFKNDNYNGYNLSLISVKYLYEILGYEEFKKLIHNNDRITEYGETVVQDAINYYQKKLDNNISPIIR